LEDLLNHVSAKAALQSRPSEPLHISFKLPVIKGALLPGNLYYLYIRSPLLIPGQAPIDVEDGCDLVTDTCDGTYFNIHVDSRGIVDSITYLGKERVEVENFVFLIGLSHYYLYHVLDRVFGGIAPTPSSTSGALWSSSSGNLLAFLRETFTPALFHDRFPELRAYLEESVLSEIDAKLAATKFGEVADGKVPSILLDLHTGLRDETKRAVQWQLLDYLRENRHHLYMYYIPN
jgi:hypothetical protein